MTPIEINKIRSRAAHFISPFIADEVGVTLQKLAQFVAGTARLSEKQLADLAARMSIELRK